MDPVLSWEMHIKHVIELCMGILALLNAVHVLPASVMLRVTVFSRARHCAQIYARTNRTAILKLQMFTFAARVISGRRKFNHLSNILQQLRWLNVEQFCKLNDMRLIHKIVITGEPETLHASVSYNYEHSSRRSNSRTFYT